MISLSYWEKESFFKNIDIAIIGSGIVGLTTAIYLKRENPLLHVVIFERGTLPIGASTRNAGFACFGSMTELLDDLTSRTEEEVFDLVKARWEGLKNLRNLIGDKILCYKPFGGFEIFKKEDQELFEKCADKMTHINKILAQVIGRQSVFKMADEKIKPFGFEGIKHIIHNNAEGQLNTGEMMRALIKKAQDLSIDMFFGIPIRSIEDHQNNVMLITENGWEIRAKKALVATNGFAKQLLPNLPLEPARNQVLITEPIDNLPFKGAFHYDRGYFYFRSVEEKGQPMRHRILLGGGRNLAPNVEQTDQFGQTELIQNALQTLLKTVIFPKSTIKIDGWWSGILGVGERKQPIVKMVSPSVGVAVRLGGMGVAIGSQIGNEAAKMIAGS
ncbi:MAG: FAD-binding oxidoreductase [Saprospiraceae bacterium]